MTLCVHALSSWPDLGWFYLGLSYLVQKIKYLCLLLLDFEGYKLHNICLVGYSSKFSTCSFALDRARFTEALSLVKWVATSVTQ